MRAAAPADLRQQAGSSSLCCQQDVMMLGQHFCCSAMKHMHASSTHTVQLVSWQGV
jgi:hypothetical protein